MGKKKVIITGATGMVGGCALRFCLEHTEVSLVTAIGRNRTGIDDNKLCEVNVGNFTDYSDLKEILENQDAVLYCLGAYTGSVPDAIFREIIVEEKNALSRSSKKW